MKEHECVTSKVARLFASSLQLHRVTQQRPPTPAEQCSAVAKLRVPISLSPHATI